MSSSFILLFWPVSRSWAGVAGDVIVFRPFVSPASLLWITELAWRAWFFHVSCTTYVGSWWALSTVRKRSWLKTHATSANQLSTKDQKWKASSWGKLGSFAIHRKASPWWIICSPMTATRSTNSNARSCPRGLDARRIYGAWTNESLIHCGSRLLKSAACCLDGMSISKFSMSGFLVEWPGSMGVFCIYVDIQSTFCSLWQYKRKPDSGSEDVGNLYFSKCSLLWEWLSKSHLG